MKKHKKDKWKRDKENYIKKKDFEERGFGRQKLKKNSEFEGKLHFWISEAKQNRSKQKHNQNKQKKS